jgi:UDP-N-acetylglucosamine 2-epimerase (non-hydrolysing)
MKLNMSLETKIKVLTIVGTRPEIIRLSRVIDKLDNYTDHLLVHTGQNYDFELNEIFFQQLSIRKPNVFLNAAGETALQTIANVISGIEKVLLDFKPEAILILGDTNSSLCAIAAKRMKIPIFHMEAGNRCFDYRVPEEINRKIVDHISDINLTYSEIARDYLIQEGFPPDQVIVTGSPMKEVLNYYKEDINKSSILKDLQLEKQKYFLVSLHREENVDSVEKLNNLSKILNQLLINYNFKIIVSTHPRTRKKIQDLNINFDNKIEFHKPFGFLDYINLQVNSYCVLSDSGTITEESSILNFRALNLREMHERPEGFKEASLVFVGLDSDRILQGINLLSIQEVGQNRNFYIVKDYDVDNVSNKILRIILSYTNYINRKIWKKII